MHLSLRRASAIAAAAALVTGGAAVTAADGRHGGAQGTRPLRVVP